MPVTYLADVRHTGTSFLPQRWHGRRPFCDIISSFSSKQPRGSGLSRPCGPGQHKAPSTAHAAAQCLLMGQPPMDGFQLLRDTTKKLIQPVRNGITLWAHHPRGRLHAPFLPPPAGQQLWARTCRTTGAVSIHQLGVGVNARSRVKGRAEVVGGLPKWPRHDAPARAASW